MLGRMPATVVSLSCLSDYIVSETALLVCVVAPSLLSLLLCQGAGVGASALSFNIIVYIVFFLFCIFFIPSFFSLSLRRRGEFRFLSFIIEAGQNV